MYEHRTPITDENFDAYNAATRSLHAAGISLSSMADEDPVTAKPLVSNATGQPRVMSAQIMGEWLRARPGVLDKDIAREFTAAERERFLEDAIDYAIRHSGDLN